MVNFGRIRQLNQQKNDLGWRIIKMEARATKSTTTITGMPRSGGTGNRMEEIIVEIATIKEAYIGICDELNNLKADLEKAMKVISNPMVRVSIHMRYIRGCKIREICETLNYSDRQVIRFLKQGESEINAAEG